MRQSDIGERSEDCISFMRDRAIEHNRRLERSGAHQRRSAARTCGGEAARLSYGF